MFRSTKGLQTQILRPLVIAVLAAAVIIAIISYAVGHRLAERRMRQRFEAISATLSTPSFRLTDSVVRTLATLTGTELITFDDQGGLLHNTCASPGKEQTRELTLQLRRLGSSLSNTEQLSILPARVNSRNSSEAELLADTGSAASHTDTDKTADTTITTSIAGTNHVATNYVAGYRAWHFRRDAVSPAVDPVATIFVLFDESMLRQERLRAAAWPLATGLSTMLLISGLAWLTTRGMVQRISDLQMEVQRIAEGNFDAASRLQRSVELDSVTSSNDELERLSQAVASMTADLKQLWTAVHRAERQKLIHQLAAGLAHQLRNSLTGARMALDLHKRDCPHAEDEDMAVAQMELKGVEDYVSRILQVASGNPAEAIGGCVGDVISDVRQSLSSVARHQSISLQWLIPSELEHRRVSDIRLLAAALQNLILNGLQAGDQEVSVHLYAQAQELIFEVRDDGPGPSDDLGSDLFDAFVSDKPEGLGLGLSLVRRAAEDMHGSASWRRESGVTVFELRISVSTNLASAESIPE